MQEAIPELTWFAVLMFCFAFVWTARKVIAVLLGPIIAVVASLPLVGGISADFLHTIEQDLDNKLGAIEHGIDKLMGASFHRFAELNDWLWREFKQHTLIGQLIAFEIRKLVDLYHYLRNLSHHNTAATEVVQHRTKTLERELHGIEHEVRELKRDYAKGIGDDVLPRLKTLDREIGRIEHKTIPAIRAAEADADTAIGNLYDWVKGKASIVGVGTFALAVASVIGANAFRLLRCPSFGNLGQKRGCGLWNDLDDLLSLVAIPLEIASLYELIGVAQTVTEEVTKGVEDLLKV